MTKKEIKTIAFNLISNYVIKGNQLPEESKNAWVFSAYSIVDMLAELNMLNDQQIISLKNNVVDGIYD